MSKQNAQAFVNKARRDPALQQKLKKLIPTKAQSQLDELVKIAAGEGFQFTSKEYMEVVNSIKKSGELSEQDLGRVAGGVGGHVPTLVYNNLCSG